MNMMKDCVASTFSDQELKSPEMLSIDLKTCKSQESASSIDQQCEKCQNKQIAEIS